MPVFVSGSRALGFCVGLTQCQTAPAVFSLCVLQRLLGLLHTTDSLTASWCLPWCWILSFSSNYACHCGNYMNLTFVWLVGTE